MSEIYDTDELTPLEEEYPKESFDDVVADAIFVGPKPRRSVRRTSSSNSTFNSTASYSSFGVGSDSCF